MKKIRWNRKIYHQDRERTKVVSAIVIGEKDEDWIKPPLFRFSVRLMRSLQGTEFRLAREA
jgi:hypothetical protein